MVPAEHLHEGRTNDCSVGVQERFRTTIQGFPAVIDTARRLVTPLLLSSPMRFGYISGLLGDSWKHGFVATGRSGEQKLFRYPSL